MRKMAGRVEKDGWESMEERKFSKGPGDQFMLEMRRSKVLDWIVVNSTFTELQP